MSGELKPRPPEWRLSDADREEATERLSAALSEGRLVLDEFEQRLAGVLAARTYGDLVPYLADLPGAVQPVSVPEFTELRTTAATLKRRGAWIVPRRLLATAWAGSVRLDFTEAVIAHHTVKIELNVQAGSTTLVLPPGASADIDSVELVASSSSVRVPGAPGIGHHFVVSGKQYAGRLVIRYRRRFRLWRRAG